MLKVLRPALGRLLTPVGEAVARTPITPNAVTVVGTVGMSASALIFFPTGHLFIGVVVCTLFVFCDMLDGTLARIKGTTGPFGAFLDSTLDRVADAAVFSGLAIYFVRGGHDRMLAAVSLYCLVAGSLVSYAKARAESLGLTCDVGFAERTERLLIGLVAAGLSGLGVPYVLPVGLWLLAAVSTFTFGQRVLATRRSAAELAAGQPAGSPAGSASTEQASTEQGSTEQGSTEQGSTEQASTEQASTEQATRAQARTGDVTGDREGPPEG